MKQVPVFLVVVVFIVTFVARLGAQTLNPDGTFSTGVDVKATVGTATLTITGYQSPFASIILKTSTGVFIASTTTDAQGYFSISNVLINNSNLTYCFQAVDFRRIGLSESCIAIPGPITGKVNYSNVFLPPTLGLSKKQINAGEDAIIYGYSMRNAKVTVIIAGNPLTVTADKNGYYTYIYKDVPAGVFAITATASLAGEDSLDPTNQVVLESRSLPQQITNTGKEVIEKVKEKTPFSFNILPFLLLALALLVAIGILLYKLRFRLWVLSIDFFRRKKKMHHDWFLDKW